MRGMTFRATPWRRAGAALMAAVAVGFAPACGGGGEKGGLRAPRAEPGTLPPVRDVATLAADDGQWVMPAKNYSSTRFSALASLDTASVKNLRLAWTFSTGQLRGHEAAPLVVNGTMYVVTPFPNVLYALDVGDGSLKWKYEPRPARAAQGVACCDVVNRGAAYADGRIFFNTLDVHTVAVDAESGAELWKTKLGDINIGESMTMAPLVVGNHVLVGNSGGEFGVRGWIKALDTGSGRVVWTAYNTGPDAEVLIDSATFRPFYEADRRPNLGVSTWSGDQWKVGGGSVWGWISYDPTLNLIYHGTGNPGVWNPALRPGDNKWSTSVFARDPRTGYARWAYQLNPHDEHDYDGVNESILVDLPLGGRERQVMLRPERNGFMYVFDRATGEVISADPYGPVTWASGIDLKSGRPVLNPETATGNRKATRVCPAAPGMKDWQPSAWSPRTQLLYLPHNHLCMDYEGVEANYVSGTPYVGAEVRMYSAEGREDRSHRGNFTAWDPVARRIVWQIPEKFPVWSGAVVTAGDVAFYGTMDRWFKAVNARTGELLWQFRTGSGIIGQPIVFRGPGDRPHVAVLAGVGGWAGAAALGILPEVDPTIALGFPNAVPDLPDHTPQGGTLYVFALP